MRTGTQGFEPRQAEPESAVLPLDDVPLRTLRIVKNRNRGEKRFASAPLRVSYGCGNRSRQTEVAGLSSPSS